LVSSKKGKNNLLPSQQPTLPQDTARSEKNEEKRPNLGMVKSTLMFNASDYNTKETEKVQPLSLNICF
jgi:hypothetical protein